MPNNKWWTLVTGILIGLLSSALIIIFTSTPRGNPIELPPIPSPAPIIVDISGAINSPGIYYLPIGSRVAEVIELSGGLLPNAHLDLINLAQILEDGQRVYIASNEYSKSGNADSTSNSDQTININTANLQLLISLPGIGETKAQGIIEYRQQQGAFVSIDGILNVPGIGEGIFNSIKNLITISSSP